MKPKRLLATYQVVSSNYSVGLLQSHAKKSALVRRYLRLYNLKQISGPPLHLSPISGVGIAFFERHPDDFGTFDQNGMINIRAPLADFDDVYRIVQTESPVHFLWSEDLSHPGKVASYSMSIPNSTAGHCCCG